MCSPASCVLLLQSCIHQTVPASFYRSTRKSTPPEVPSLHQEPGALTIWDYHRICWDLRSRYTLDVGLCAWRFGTGSYSSVTGCSVRELPPCSCAGMWSLAFTAAEACKYQGSFRLEVVGLSHPLKHKRQSLFWGTQFHLMELNH